jgi:hypothetical protein
MLAKTAQLGLLVTLFFAALALPSAAQQPSYVLLRPSSRVDQDCKTTHWKPSKNYYVSRTPYAYGYFGAAASDKWYRSSNYNRSYTQWQRK